MRELNSEEAKNVAGSVGMCMADDGYASISDPHIIVPDLSEFYGAAVAFASQIIERVALASK